MTSLHSNNRLNQLVLLGIYVSIGYFCDPPTDKCNDRSGARPAGLRDSKIENDDSQAKPAIRRSSVDLKGKKQASIGLQILRQIESEEQGLSPPVDSASQPPKEDTQPKSAAVPETNTERPKLQRGFSIETQIYGRRASASSLSGGIGPPSSRFSQPWSKSKPKDHATSSGVDNTSVKSSGPDSKQSLVLQRKAEFQKKLNDIEETLVLKRPAESVCSPEPSPKEQFDHIIKELEEMAEDGK